MKATFHLSADFKVQVENEPGGVRFSTFRGVCYDHKLDAAECKEVTVESCSLSKQHARAIASAMMGCAVDVVPS